MAEITRRAQPLLGTFVEVAVPAQHAGGINCAFSAVREIHQLMSFHEAASDVSRINHARAGVRIDCDQKTMEVLALALSLYIASDGHFDITVASELVRSGFLPGRRSAALRSATGSPLDIVIESDTTLRLKRRVQIDLGGIAKGYAVDRAIGALQEQGVRSGLVNAGGDLRCFGDEPWPVWLRGASGAPEKEIRLPSCAVASSENRRTRRRIWLRGVTPHIGRDRRPVFIDRMVTVVADCCAVADALTKVAMVDPVLADRLLAAHGGYVLQPRPAHAEALS